MLDNPPLRVVSELGGLPLLDPGYCRSELLHKVASVRRIRHEAAGHMPAPVEHYLDPLLARTVYDESDETSYVVGANDPSAEIQNRLDGARELICAAMPEWEDFFQLPLRIRIAPTDDYFGYSNVVEPQHLYLAALGQQESSGLLLENFLHEFAHIWLYLLQEIAPFETGQRSNSYTLPSGNSGRSLTATMDAAFVAAVLRRYYARIGNVERRSELTAYLGGCVLTIRGDSEFTDTGRDVCLRLAQELTVAFVGENVTEASL